MALFNPSRDEVRLFFFETWAKFRQNQTLSDIEKVALNIIHMHPEYHYTLDTPEHYQNQVYFPEMGETNPFLHMSLHLAILEQLSIDQPTGISSAYRQLCAKYEDEHSAQHVLLECLAETIWRAQCTNVGLDTLYYLDLIQQHSGTQPQ